MSVLNALALDHFYISLPDSKIALLQGLTEKLNGRHSKVQSGQDSWEGLYTSSRIGDYAEFLQSRRSGGFGIALSAQHMAYTNAKELLKEIPSSPLKTGTRVDSFGEPWFDWYSAVPYEDHENLVFNFWVMDFYKSHIDYKSRIKKRIVDSFDSIEGIVGEKYVSEFERAAALLPIGSVLENDTIHFSVPRRDGYNFEVRIKFLDGDSRFQPLKMNFTLYSNAHQNIDLNQFDFVTNLGNNQYSLNFEAV